MKEGSYPCGPRCLDLGGTGAGCWVRGRDRRSRVGIELYTMYAPLSISSSSIDLYKTSQSVLQIPSRKIWKPIILSLGGTASPNLDDRDGNYQKRKVASKEKAGASLDLGSTILFRNIFEYFPGRRCGRLDAY